MAITRDTALTAILAKTRLTNEAGDDLVDFTSQGRDALDFTSISRGTLKAMLEAAYEAGRAAK